MALSFIKVCTINHGPTRGAEHRNPCTGIFLFRMNFKLDRRVGLGVIGLLFCAGIVQAQVDSGSITGQITDPSGGVVAGASVTLLNEDTQLALKSASDQGGNYSFSPVRVGTYTLSVESAGFSKSNRLHVGVRIQQQVAINIELQPGRLEQSVDVTAAAELLQTGEARAKTFSCNIN
jgi:hypothetical protein